MVGLIKNNFKFVLTLMDMMVLDKIDQEGSLNNIYCNKKLIIIFYNLQLLQ